MMVFALLLFVALLFSDEQDSGFSNIHYGGVNVSVEVLVHKPMVEKYAREYGIEEYVNVLLAIIQVESGGYSGRCDAIIRIPWTSAKQP